MNDEHVSFRSAFILHRSAFFAPPQSLRLCSQKSSVSQATAHAADLTRHSSRKAPGSRSSVDRVIDVQKRAVAESPAALLESLELDRNGERAHRTFAILIEEAIEVAQSECDVRIDRLPRAQRCEVGFGDAAPQAIRFIERKGVAVVLD